MKKRFLAICLILMLMLSSCQMEEVIPDQEETLFSFEEDEAQYQKAVDALLSLEFECMVSRTDYYSPEGSEDFTGLYIQNIDDNTFEKCEIEAVVSLFSNSDVKIISTKTVGELKICAFDLCVPRRNFGYGIYYASVDEPIYIGDPSIDLTEAENGYQYEKKASYGTKFTFFTRKVTEHFYYYEIL